MKRNILGQASWTIRTNHIEAFVTETGGHLGPVIFDRGRRKIAPFSLAPWAQEKLDRSIPTILKVLRGDFFCMPFGGNSTPYRGERHPVHGETANSKWTFESLDATAKGATLHLSLRPKVRPGRVDKFVFVPGDHDAIYQRHVVSGMLGPMNLGHHATLKFPDEPGSGVISTSRFVRGQVFPQPVERPEEGGYSILKPGALFKSLMKVPTITGENADLSRYPARRGFEDIAMLVSDNALPFAWTAVTFAKQGYVWFALKDPKVLRETVLWISNGGRHYAPWNGRHVNVMGLEEVTSYFHSGLAESVAKNSLSARGIPTHLMLSRKKPLTVNYIMAVAKVPREFHRVGKIVAQGDGVTLISDRGARVSVRMDIQFLQRASGSAFDATPPQPEGTAPRSSARPRAGRLRRR